jgi:hypothetical protein
MVDIRHMFLIGRIVDQDVEVAEVTNGLLDGLLAELAVRNVARYRDTFLSLGLDAFLVSFASSCSLR